MKEKEDKKGEKALGNEQGLRCHTVGRKTKIWAWVVCDIVYPWFRNPSW